MFRFLAIESDVILGRGESKFQANFMTTENRIYLFNSGYTALTPLHGCSRFLLSLFAVAIGRMRPSAIRLTSATAERTQEKGGREEEHCLTKD